MEAPSEKKAVTQSKIAEEAGVHRTVVNKILRGQGQLYSEETRKRVLEVADRLGYRPDRQFRPYVRAFSRERIEWKVGIKVPGRSGSPSVIGEAVMKNVSRGGAFFRDLALTPACLPLGHDLPWEIILKEGPFKGQMWMGVLVRYSRRGFAIEWREPLAWGRF